VVGLCIFIINIFGGICLWFDMYGFGDCVYELNEVGVWFVCEVVDEYGVLVVGDFGLMGELMVLFGMMDAVEA